MTGACSRGVHPGPGMPGLLPGSHVPSIPSGELGRVTFKTVSRRCGRVPYAVFRSVQESCRVSIESDSLYTFAKDSSV